MPELTCTVVLPFFNEEDFLARTLTSLSQQRMRPFHLVLVDNASTDRSVAIATDWARQNSDIDVMIVSDDRPGKINALETGVSQSRSDIIVTCDADTLYPPHYLTTCVALFENAPDVVAVLATDIWDDPETFSARLQRVKVAAVAKILPKQCHSGGYGQAFRTAALKACGGFSTALWNHSVEDHEIVHRILRFGVQRYSYRHWCQPSDRRTDRRNVDWTLAERLLYHVTPWAAKNWFFYRFLSPRLKKRGNDNLSLRARTWDSPTDPNAVTDDQASRSA